jgi:hypothetical protein
MYQRTTEQNFRPRRVKILEIQQKKDRLAEPPPSQGLKGAFWFLEISISFDYKIQLGDSKGIIKWDKRSIT